MDEIPDSGKISGDKSVESQPISVCGLEILSVARFLLITTQLEPYLQMGNLISL